MGKIFSTYKAGEPCNKIGNMERSYIHLPEQQWMYSHHPSITVFKGRYFAIWSNGRLNEDDVGQRVMISSSSDGLEWTIPVPLVDSVQGQHSELVLTAAGFHQYKGTLVAYAGSYEYNKEHLSNGQRKAEDLWHERTDLLALSTEDGKVWSSPESLHLPIVPNHGPETIFSGRLIMSGNISFPYTDDPSGLSGWTMSGIYPPTMQDRICDDASTFQAVQKKQGWPVALCEGSFFQTNDGVLHMLLRSSGCRLWCSHSGDSGESWSEPEPTGMLDNSSKFHVGRLPDGRFYYVGNPEPEPLGARTPLVLSLSNDGVCFDQHWILGNDEYCQRQEGMYKIGQYGYPHTLVHDEHLFVVFSRLKEAIQGLKIHLADLST